MDLFRIGLPAQCPAPCARQPAGTRDLFLAHASPPCGPARAEVSIPSSPFPGFRRRFLLWRQMPWPADSRFDGFGGNAFGNHVGANGIYDLRRDDIIAVNGMQGRSGVGGRRGRPGVCEPWRAGEPRHVPKAARPSATGSRSAGGERMWGKGEETLWVHLQIRENSAAATALPRPPPSSAGERWAVRCRWVERKRAGQHSRTCPSRAERRALESRTSPRQSRR